jgi:hypothetical protein
MLATRLGTTTVRTRKLAYASAMSKYAKLWGVALAILAMGTLLWLVKDYVLALPRFSQGPY